MGSRLVIVSDIAAVVVLGAATTLSVDVLRTSCTNGSSSVASNWKDSTPGLPISNACGDCTLGVGTGEMTTTSRPIVESIMEI